MLFNSYEFLLFFLPITLIVYIFLNKLNLKSFSNAWLVGCSLFFYGYWNPSYLTLIILSVFINYSFGQLIASRKLKRSHNVLALLIGISINLAALIYFKYTDFFISTLNQTLSTSFPTLNIVLPLAISFFTFQQIAYLVDMYQDNSEQYSFLNYCLFVTFFPQLIAGPIVHHKEMMPQLLKVQDKWNINWENITSGIFIFSIGLFKKVVIADNFAYWSNIGFNNSAGLDIWAAWVTSLSYTLQLYYDFSGYADMAIGAALLFNIKLPDNFNSPYKAKNIQDFWHRWHMTLSRWLRDYVYIPLGGNRKGEAFTLRNVALTAIISGIWHGAGWTFILWGACHGIAMVVHRLWSKLNINLNKSLCWLLTFIFINLTWVIFRAESFQSAKGIIYSMIGLNGLSSMNVELSLILTLVFGENSTFADNIAVLFPMEMVVIFSLVAFAGPNSLEILNKRKTKANSFSQLKYAAATSGLIFVTALSFFGNAKPSEFLYFNF